MADHLTPDGELQAGLAAVTILISVGIAVFTPVFERWLARRRERRARLGVTATRSEPSSIRLELSYLPEFTHIGLRAVVRLRSPDLLIRSLYLVSKPDPNDLARLHFNASGVFVGGDGVVRLVRRGGEGKPFDGAVLIQPAHETPSPGHIVKQAKVEIEILADDNRRLLKVPLLVSPVDEERSWWESG